MPIRPELRPLYPPYWRELSSHVRFERAGGRCQRCADPILPSSAASRTGAGSTNKRRPGGIAVDVLPVGPTLRRHLVPKSPTGGVWHSAISSSVHIRH
jgi:hypothetical protein